MVSSVFPEINFPAEFVMKINNPFRPNLPAPSPKDQMVVQIWPRFKFLSTDDARAMTIVLRTFVTAS